MGKKGPGSTHLYYCRFRSHGGRELPIPITSTICFHNSLDHRPSGDCSLLYQNSDASDYFVQYCNSVTPLSTMEYTSVVSVFQ